MHLHSPTGNGSGISFHHPRHPHSGQLWLASIAAIIYAAAVPGLLMIHNPLAAVGWGVACILCACWALLLRQENKYRRIENLEQSPLEAVDEYGSTLASPLSHTRNSLHSQPLLTTTTQLQSTFPCFLNKITLVMVVMIGVGLIGFAAYLFAIAGINGERLNGKSHWLSAIAFVASAKSAGQLAWRMVRVRNTFASVMTYLSEQEHNFTHQRFDCTGDS